MASVTSRPNGHKWVQFLHRGKKYTIRLGTIEHKRALRFAARVDDLKECARLGQRPTPDVLSWARTIDKRARVQLSKAGLLSARDEGLSLSEVINRFERSLHVKDSTLIPVRQATGNLLAYFGDADVADIDEQQATDYYRWLLNSGGFRGEDLAPATASRRLRRARQVFAFAKRIGCIDINPFSNVRRSTEINRARDHFVTREDIEAVLKCIKKPDLRAIVVLARYCALRIPSEIQPLVVSDVDYSGCVLKVHSPKTGFRKVPLFPEVVPYLQKITSGREGLLFPEHQATGQAVRNQLIKACRRAHIAPWPRLWKNMRSTRETELIESYPLPTVASWLGHSPLVALQHYTQVMADSAVRAAGEAKGEAVGMVRNGSEPN